MRSARFVRARTTAPGLAALLIVAVGGVGNEVLAEVPATYVIDFLATASDGVDMNDHGAAIGDRGLCGWPCAEPSEIGVWFGGDFLALPLLPQWENVYLEAINNNGWIVGTAYNQVDIRGVVWKPVPTGYEVLEIPNLPETDYTTALGIDDSNRVIGFANRQFPVVHKPLLWTEAGGSTDLTDLGFPGDHPQAISPAGTVAYLYGWYELDVPGVVHENAGPPEGFRGPGAYFNINDSGDQIRLIVRTNGEPIHYPFRYLASGDWQQIWPFGGIDQSPFGVGSITKELDISATISANGIVASGPAGMADDLSSKLSPAYGDSTIAAAGAMNESGEILAEATTGRSNRLVRLVAGEPCTVDCMVVSQLEFQADFVDDPDDPGRCVGQAYTRARTRMRVVDENGAPLEGVRLTGRFLDSYWLDGQRQGVTDDRGRVSFTFAGPPCQGTMSFLVTALEMEGRTFDRVNGTLTKWQIPQ